MACLLFYALMDKDSTGSFKDWGSDEATTRSFIRHSFVVVSKCVHFCFMSHNRLLSRFAIRSSFIFTTMFFDNLLANYKYSICKRKKSVACLYWHFHFVYTFKKKIVILIFISTLVGHYYLS